MRKSSWLLLLLFSIVIPASAWGGSSGSAQGVGEVGEVACSDLTDDAASCATDATNAANIVSGTLPALRLTAGAVTQFETDLEGVLDLGDLQSSLPLGDKTSGGYAGSSTEGGAADSGDSATNFFTVGTLNTARLGSGTADSTTFLRGDQTWAVPTSAAPTFITPATLTADQDDWAPTGHDTADVWLVSANATRNLYGIAGGVAGRRLTLINIGSNTIMLHNEFGTSVAANRLALRNGGYSGAAALPGGVALTLIYDGSALRWRPYGFVLSDIILPAGQFGGTPWRVSGTGNMVIVDTQAGGNGILGTAVLSLGNVTTADTTIERGGAAGVYRFTALATAPATCTAARDAYFDTSGAWCVCTSTNTWTNTTGVGACT